MHTKTFTASLDELNLMQNFIQDCCQKIGFDSSTINQITVATEEVLVNIISYSYPQEKGTITIECKKLTPNLSIEIKILDGGIPFNPLEHTDPSSPSLDSELGGYGIYLVKCIMDEINYQFAQNQNILTLTKHLK